MLYKRESGWKELSAERKEAIFAFAEGYKHYLDVGKTERKCVAEAIRMAEQCGFVAADAKETLAPGDKVWFNNRDKNVVLAVIGSDDLEKGANFVVSHIDSPRLDLKQHPVYEDTELALMKTHYYGGIKKYQWASRPLAMHGVVVLKDGRKVEITIGENDSDPVFTIPDLLPHLDQHVQRDRKASEVLKGEEMNILVGSIPATINDAEIKELVKYNVLQKLHDSYGMIEEDFISAELRALFDGAEIKWQTGMLGKVDEGGGGTVAMFLAHYGIRTIDAGAALLSMHSPLEIASKFDIHEIYRAYQAFYG